MNGPFLFESNQTGCWISPKRPNFDKSSMIPIYFFKWFLNLRKSFQIIRTFSLGKLSFLNEGIFRAILHSDKESLDDAQITSQVKKAQGGDQSSFLWLVGEYQKRIYGLVFRIVGNKEDAEEVTQDTFVKLYEKLKTLKDPGKFQSWAFRTATNLALNRIKHEKVRGKGRTQSLEGWTDENSDAKKPDLISTFSGPDENAQQEETKKMINRVLNDLSLEHRTILILREMEGLDYDELSEVLNIGIGTVKSRLNQARNNFKEKWLKRHPEILP